MIFLWLPGISGASLNNCTTFGELTRGLLHNTGVPAGTLIGVECFMAFIATCTSMTGKNKDLVWAALYADDTSPLVQSSFHKYQ